MYWLPNLTTKLKIYLYSRILALQDSLQIGVHNYSIMPFLLACAILVSFVRLITAAPNPAIGYAITPSYDARTIGVCGYLRVESRLLHVKSKWLCISKVVEERTFVDIRIAIGTKLKTRMERKTSCNMPCSR